MIQWKMSICCAYTFIHVENAHRRTTAPLYIKQAVLKTVYNVERRTKRQQWVTSKAKSVKNGKKYKYKYNTARHNSSADSNYAHIKYPHERREL